MSNIAQKIQEVKASLGDKVCIVGHHYQAEEVVRHCDIAGDSLELARKVAAVTAPHIIFCGVYFMAESAALLAREGQSVYIPDADADCVMSQMAPAPLLEIVLTKLCEEAQAKGKTIVPLAYVNTSLAVKDVVGRFGGAVCTSANASTMLKWALGMTDDNSVGDAQRQVLFLPDQNLGRNTAAQLGLSEKDWHSLNVRKQGTCLDLEAASKARILLWPGYCPIHEDFSTEQVAAMREKYPQCKVVVHPESTPEVVNASDGSGSTSYLIDYVAGSTKGSTIIIGTETNLVQRLGERFANHCTVIPLRITYCSDMGKITEEKLLQSLMRLHNAEEAREFAVKIPSAQMEAARKSLERMLEACAKAGV